MSNAPDRSLTWRWEDPSGNTTSINTANTNNNNNKITNIRGKQA